MNYACAIALKIANILAAQALAQSFTNYCGASAIASKIVAPQVPISEYAIISKIEFTTSSLDFRFNSS